MMIAKEIRIAMVENYNGAETISYKTKKEAAEWKDCTFEVIKDGE